MFRPAFNFADQPHNGALERDDFLQLRGVRKPVTVRRPCPHAALCWVWGGVASAFTITPSRAERLLIVAPVGSGFFSLSFQREKVVG